MEHSIAIIVQNIIQWYSIRKLAIFLKEKKQIPVDIYLYDPEVSSTDFHNIANDTAEAIKADAFTPNTNPKKINYKICLAPYSNMINLKCQYKLGYCYGAATTKPLFTLDPSVRIGFHGFFLHDTYGAELFSVYGKTYIVPDLYLNKITKHTQSIKPTILFLPTYHEPSTIQTAQSLNSLKDKYYIIIKSHHGTDNLNDEKDKKNLLTKIADEIYPSTYPIEQLFEKCDVVLSDNSGAVMDALYCNAPVAIAAPDINNSIPNVNTLQYELVKAGIIPYSQSSSADGINSVILSALSEAQHKKQCKVSSSIFPTKTGGAEAWYKIIKLYLTDNVEQNYCHVHDFVTDKYNKLERDNLKLSQEITDLKKSLEECKTQLNLYQNSRLHRAVNNLHRIVHSSK